MPMTGRNAVADPNMKNFEQRLARIDKIHKAGGAFESSGTLGRAYFDATRPRRRRGVSLRALAFLFAAALLFKAAILAQLGQDGYAERVAALANGSVFEQAGAWVLQADPATLKLAGFIQPILR
jgi:hypothetical protein